jgi:hypothetical protein
VYRTLGVNQLILLKPPSSLNVITAIRVNENLSGKRGQFNGAGGTN